MAGCFPWRVPGITGEPGISGESDESGESGILNSLGTFLGIREALKSC